MPLKVGYRPSCKFANHLKIQKSNFKYQKVAETKKLLLNMFKYSKFSLVLQRIKPFLTLKMQIAAKGGSQGGANKSGGCTHPPGKPPLKNALLKKKE
jgi:hypothetical protein